MAGQDTGAQGRVLVTAAVAGLGGVLGAGCGRGGRGWSGGWGRARCGAVLGEMLDEELVEALMMLRLTVTSKVCRRCADWLARR